MTLRHISRAILAVIAVAALSVSAQAGIVTLELAYPAPAAIPDNGPALYNYYVDSLVQYDNAEANPSYYYYWEIDNCSTTNGITSWTWAGGNVLELGITYVVSDPMPFGPAEGSISKFAAADLDGTFDAGSHWPTTDPRWAPVMVSSSVMFSNGQVENHNIYVPTGVVPEPGSFAGLLVSLVGFASAIRRKS